MGPDAAYRRLLANGSRPHFIGYYCIVMGLQGRPWNDCRGKEKDDLRARFDAIVASVQADDSAVSLGIEAVLNEIGTGLRR
ncbi:TfoX-like protein [Celeribacter persicus]|uniref:TfoX-like protein n=2 Tax=Celeribacter persicus TaxID=1651082 RepID=A0A2T5HUI6_9RHOB|nr:TfoX-like protein [Celeribacter persicus]